ncbi:hypothetical protein ABZ770_40900 [Streptomyces sp. NPDC006654]|uniref:hypothetical protein n=1 Tax=Streptomyces sp. NPDC006654 TaxID=3156897 RepID=UPI0033E5195F
MSATHSAPARGRRRLLAAAVLALVTASALTGCRDGQGVRDEGPSAASLTRPGDTTHSGPAGTGTRRPADTEVRWATGTGSRPHR